MPGYNLKISLDLNIQEYCQQAARMVMEEKPGGRGFYSSDESQNGEIYACINVPNLI